MRRVPTKYTLGAGDAEGDSRLTAFDKALLKAGVGDMNLLKVSSILPPHARKVDKIDLPRGSLLPTAYASIVSEEPGERIAAAVAVGVSTDEGFGVIMEWSGRGDREMAGERVTNMVREALATRGLELAELSVAASDHVVERIGCCVAVVALWD